MSDPLAMAFLRDQLLENGARVHDPKPGDDSMLVCSRVEDWPPHVPSDHGVCDQCGVDIFWSKSAPPCRQRVCMRCAAVSLAKQIARGETPEFALTPAVKREVERELGRPVVLLPRKKLR
jgi:hypothetical protein